jgi:hypothetical protein
VRLHGGAFEPKRCQDESLLSAVVQVAFEPLSRLVCRDHDACARGLDLGG